MIEAGDEHGWPLVEPFKGWDMKMIAVRVGDVDVVDLGELRRIQIHIRQVPPAAEICRADEPGIHQDAGAGVSKHCHLHR